MKKLLLIATAVFLMAPVGLMATAIAPGGTISSPTSLGYGYTNGGTLLADTGAVNFTSGAGSADFTGVNQEQVWSDPSNTLCSGCLDFVFAFTDTGGSNPIARATASSFGSFLVSAGYNTANTTQGGSIAPSDITRSANGNVIAFDFTSGVINGQTTYVLVIQTNALAFNSGSLSFQNGGTAYMTGYQPSPVPEPATVALVALGLLALGAGTLLKRRQVSM